MRYFFVAWNIIVLFKMLDLSEWLVKLGIIVKLTYLKIVSMFLEMDNRGKGRDVTIIKLLSMHRKTAECGWKSIHQGDQTYFNILNLHTVNFLCIYGNVYYVSRFITNLCFNTSRKCNFTSGVFKHAIYSHDKMYRGHPEILQRNSKQQEY